MPDLPTCFAGLILAFKPLFVHRSWRHAQILMIGAILTPGQRTVTSVLRIMGRAQDRRFVNVHRILNRAAWCPRTGGRILLGLLIAAFVPRGPVVLGIDDTIERRRGRRIAAKGIYRDPVRSSDSHFVKASGLRWMSLMLLAPIPWAGRIWALPFLTALVPSERACRERGRRHKPLLDIGRQLALQARRWLPGRDLVLVGDGGFCALNFLDAMRRGRITAVTRLRLDAALYEPAPPRPPGTIGRPRTKGARLPTLAATLAAEDTLWHRLTVPGWYGPNPCSIEVVSGTAVWRHGGLPVVPIRWVLVRDPQNRFPPQSLLCTDLACDASQILSWFVRRWSVEVTFQEARAHLGVETQRQWSDTAIARTTPCLLALFSIVTLLAARLPARQRRSFATAAWYHKPRPTFADALAAVRWATWRERTLATSPRRQPRTKPRFRLPSPWAYALCHAA
ncbi:IS701 family transposase [Antarcticirhabdus aurantiaca]|uniref:Transposase n=1 Tax=Antarcticirhabdus aurantiaca TaxID=2606717 RepID=A0ACD4NRY7_9HYPH|nr:transposase [Antarcticirhabdus aurantiaca]WAJ29487.1 transposase [Jeongeuplla avenae]